MKQEWIDNTLDKIRLNYHIDNNWINNDNEIDGLDGNIRLNIDNQWTDWNVEIKDEVRNYQLEEIRNKAEKNQPFIIIARRIFPKLKEFFRDNNIAYLEGNGNIFLTTDKVYILVDGNKPLMKEKPTGLRIFTRTGLKLIFEFLLDETAVNLPYRKLAEKAGIGLGNVNNLMRDLKDQGYLLKTGQDGWRLMKKKELLENWVAAYPEKLKPAIKAGQFRFLKPEDFDNWKKIKIKPMKTWWGGEPGGDLLTHYLRPERLTLYTMETREELIRNYRLIPDENGNVEVYNKFWDRNTVDEEVAPPLLVYADLMNTGDPRCIETAKKVFDEYLAGQF